MRSLLLILMVIILAASPSGDALAARPHAEICISATSSACGRFVELKEIAKIESADALLRTRLWEVPVAQCPELGAVVVLRLGDITNAIVSAGLNLAHLNLTGPLEIKVTGREESGPPAARERDTVIASAEQAIVAASKASAEDIEIFWEDIPKDLVQLVDEGHRIQIEPVGPVQTSGSLGVTVRFYDGRHLACTRKLRASVRLYRTVVVARRSIGRGSKVQPESLETRRDLVKGQLEDAFCEIADVAGVRTRGRISAGTVIRDRMVEPAPLVYRGDVVTLVVRQGGFELSTTGTALADGVAGQRIGVERKCSTSGNDRRPKKIPLAGVVVGPGTVLLGSPGES